MLDDITHPNIKTSCASQPSPAAFSSRLAVPKAEAVAQPGASGMCGVASGSSRAASAIPAQSSPSGWEHGHNSLDEVILAALNRELEPLDPCILGVQHGGISGKRNMLPVLVPHCGTRQLL